MAYKALLLICCLLILLPGCARDSDNNAHSLSIDDDDDLPVIIDMDDDDNDDDNDTVEPFVTGRFDPLEEDGFYAMPFPIDLRLNDDGSIRVDDFPNPRNSAILNRYIEVGQRDARGFGANSGILFSFTGAVDIDDLPQTDFDSMAESSPGVYRQH